MTKLYCPKGHETENLKNEFSNTVGFLRLWCSECARPYLEMDCLTQTQINSNSVESHQIKNVDDANVVESKVIPSEMQWINPKRESQIAIDRVVQALDKLSDFHMFNELKNVLKEFKK